MYITGGTIDGKEDLVGYATEPVKDIIKKWDPIIKKHEAINPFMSIMLVEKDRAYVSTVIHIAIVMAVIM